MNLGAVDNIGDFNGDGVDDIILGNRQGHSGILFGSTNGFGPLIDFRSTPNDDGIFFRGSGTSGGHSIANAGYLNGDGLSDDRGLGGKGTANLLVLLDDAATVDLTPLDRFSGIERVRLADGQTITGVDADIRWCGRGGDETFNLGDSDDIVRAGGGADTFIFASGGGIGIVHDYVDGTDLLDVSA